MIQQKSRVSKGLTPASSSLPTHPHIWPFEILFVPDAEQAFFAHHI